MVFPADKRGLNPKEITIAEILKKGAVTPPVASASGIWAIKRPSCRWLKDSTNTRAFPIPTTCGSEENPKRKYPPLPWIKETKPVAHIPDHHSQALITDAITDAAVHFINQNKDKVTFLRAVPPPTWSPLRDWPKPKATP